MEEGRRRLADNRLPSIELRSAWRPEINPDPLCLDDIRRLARQRIDADVWDYLEGGAEQERTVAANRRGYTRIELRPRVLVDVSACDPSTSLLGDALATPVGVAPTAYHRLVHPEGEVATARGAGAAGALYVVSTFASRTLEDIAAASGGPLWLQLYWWRRREVMVNLIDRAARSGYRALVLTVDTPRMGRRWRDLRNGFAVAPDIVAVNIDRALMAVTHRATAGRSALAEHSVEAFDPSVTWSDLAWLRERSALPLVLKGILTAEDAGRAVDAGVDAVVVSNHGGRQLDRVPATIDALPEVVDAVAGACPVLVDGGVRHGADVFVALSRGASAVLLGRPVLWGLAVGGADGVADVLRMVGTELVHTMTLAGRPTLKDIDRSATRAVGHGGSV